MTPGGQLTSQNASLLGIATEVRHNILELAFSNQELRFTEDGRHKLKLMSTTRRKCPGILLACRQLSTEGSLVLGSTSRLVCVRICPSRVVNRAPAAAVIKYVRHLQLIVPPYWYAGLYATFDATPFKQLEVLELITNHQGQGLTLPPTEDPRKQEDQREGKADMHIKQNVQRSLTGNGKLNQVLKDSKRSYQILCTVKGNVYPQGKFDLYFDDTTPGREDTLFHLNLTFDASTLATVERICYNHRTKIRKMWRSGSVKTYTVAEGGSGEATLLKTEAWVQD